MEEQLKKQLEDIDKRITIENELQWTKNQCKNQIEDIEKEAAKEGWDFDSIECKIAISSIINPPNVSGKQLEEYYENRKLTTEQMRAIVHKLTKATLKRLVNDPEGFKSGMQHSWPPPEPDMKKLISCMDELYPESRPVPWPSLLQKLGKEIGGKFTCNWHGLKHDNETTGLYESDIERAFRAHFAFGHTPDEALDALVKIIRHKLGIPKKWWKFWA